MDQGPWKACIEGVACLIVSGDFTHDVALHITGDFSSLEERYKYGQFIANRLNGKHCRKCGGEMIPSKALRQTLVMGVPDFPGNTIDSIGQTLSPGGPGRLVDCMKCSECGWSVTEKQT